jgi:hypothetical protein
LVFLAALTPVLPFVDRLTFDEPVLFFNGTPVAVSPLLSSRDSSPIAVVCLSKFPKSISILPVLWASEIKEPSAVFSS